LYRQVFVSENREYLFSNSRGLFQVISYSKYRADLIESPEHQTEILSRFFGRVAPD
jgi:hypothetical protein